MSQDSLALAGCWNGAADASISLLRPSDPSGTSSSYNSRWCAPILGGIGNTSFDYASRDLLPSYSAI